MPTPAVDAIGVVVTDLKRSTRFYNRLGCTFAEADNTAGHTESELSGGMRLMLDTVETLQSFGALEPGAGPPGPGNVSLAVRCGSPTEVDQLFAALDAEGLGVLAPFDAPWGQRYAGVQDPDGTHVDLYAALES
jgi:catechol 2,3-dioxygenase-like lactoylglutathione lyase family enzyme